MKLRIGKLNGVRGERGKVRCQFLNGPDVEMPAVFYGDWAIRASRGQDGGVYVIHRHTGFSVGMRSRDNSVLKQDAARSLLTHILRAELRPFKTMRARKALAEFRMVYIEWLRDEGLLR